MSKNLDVVNSQARNESQTSNQKVVFRIDKTYGEIEMRNDSEVHYREVKFWLYKMLTFELLLANIKESKRYEDKYKGRIIVYGNAAKKFGRWK